MCIYFIALDWPNKSFNHENDVIALPNLGRRRRRNESWFHVPHPTVMCFLEPHLFSATTSTPQSPVHKSTTPTQVLPYTLSPALSPSLIRRRNSSPNTERGTSEKNVSQRVAPSSVTQTLSADSLQQTFDSCLSKPQLEALGKKVMILMFSNWWFTYPSLIWRHWVKR